MKSKTKMCSFCGNENPIEAVFCFVCKREFPKTISDNKLSETNRRKPIQENSSLSPHPATYNNSLGETEITKKPQSCGIILIKTILIFFLIWLVLFCCGYRFLYLLNFIFALNAQNIY